MPRSLIISILMSGLLFPISAFADNFVGKVLDESGVSLSGATVKIEHSKDVMQTDGNGVFEFVVKDKSEVRITVSYIGFVPATRVVYSDKPIADNIVRMVPDQTVLNEVVVTATRTPKTLKDVPVVTRLISADEIRKSDAGNIRDLLVEELPGLEFGYAMTQEVSLNMNGFGGNAILFLVDGERLAGETMDNVDYNRLHLENVGRVEIVKGASSALYGANAVGGVVNLISKENDEPWHFNVNSRYRNAGNEWRNGGNLNFNQGKWTSNTSVQHSMASTVKLTGAFDTESKIHEVFGGEIRDVKERLSYRVTDNIRLTARGGCFSRVSNRSNYDDHYSDYNGGLRGCWSIGDTRNVEISYGYDQYDKARFAGGKRTHDHDYSNRQHIVRGLYTETYGKNVLSVGADYMHDYLTTYQFKNNAANSQITTDVFVQWDCNPLTWLNVVASVRDDYFSASRNNAVTSRLATLFKFNTLRIRLSYAGGFRAPTLKEMYMNFDMAGIQMIYGNPDLKPERSHNFNVALEQNGYIKQGVFAGSYSLTLSGYRNDYNSRITTTDFPGDAGREEGAIYCNEDGVKVMGMDFNARYKTGWGLGISCSYNHLHTIGGTIDSQFTQPRPHSATYRLDYERRMCDNYKIYAALSGRYLSKPVSKYETDGAYSLWKLTLQQYLWDGIKVNFIIDNLLNYKPQVYYWNSAPTIGRTWSVGLSMDINDLI